MLRHRRRQQGSILVITLLVLGALTILGVATIALSGFDSEVAINQRSGDQALYVAEAGVALGADLALADLSRVNGFTTSAKIKNSGTDVYFPGNNQGTDMALKVGPSPDENGQSVQCGLTGYSDRFGSVRFKVNSTGNGPGGAKREVEAHMLLPPQEGICPPGNNVKGGYQGG